MKLTAYISVQFCMLIFSKMTYAQTSGSIFTSKSDFDFEDLVVPCVFDVLAESPIGRWRHILVLQKHRHFLKKSIS
jgi:hypothetical protein